MFKMVMTATAVLAFV